MMATLAFSELVLSSFYSNDLLKYKYRVIKHTLPERKKKKKKFIGKEKSATVTKVKLVTQIKKHNQPYFRTLVLIALHCHCGYST